MRHEFHPEAALEFEEAVHFYKERGRNLGKRLAREVKTTIRKIVATPDRWRVLEEDVRRCLVRVFPYSVLYTIEAARLVLQRAQLPEMIHAVSRRFGENYSPGAFTTE